MTTRSRSIVIGVIVPLVIAIAGLAAMVAAIPALPSPIAVHWGLSGAPDRFGDPAGEFVLVAVLALAWSVFSFLISKPLPDRDGITFNQRLVIAIGPFMVTLVTVLVAGSLVIQRGVVDAHSGPSITPVLLLAIGSALILGVAAWFLLPRHIAVTSDAVAPPHTLDLAPSESAVFTQHLQLSRLTTVLLVGVMVVALVGGGIVMWLAAPFWAFVFWVVLFAVLIVGVVGTLSWRVTIDVRQIRVRSLFGYPRFVIPMTAVSSARRLETAALRQFGGYGIRWAGRGRWGVITRSGESLEVTSADGSILTVTVGQAETAARLVNSFVARAAKGTGSAAKRG